MAVNLYEQHRPREATVTVSQGDVAQNQDYSGDFVCDGTADDVEIQAAATYVGALGGGLVHLSGGTYYFDVPGVTLPDSVWLDGEGYITLIYLNDLQGTDIITCGSYCTVSNLRIDGNVLNQVDDATLRDGVFFPVGATDGCVHHCWIKSCMKHSIRYWGNRGLIHNNKLWDAFHDCLWFGDYVVTPNSEHIVMGNHFGSSKVVSIVLHGSFDVVICGNVFTCADTDQASFITADSELCYDITIADNTFTGETEYHGIRLRSPWTQRWVIIGNTFRETRGIFADDGVGVSDNIISNNIFYSPITEVIYLYNGATDNLISNNIIIDPSTTPIQIDLWISENKCVRNMVIGNKIYGGTGRTNYYTNGSGAISVDASHTIVQGNFIYNFGLHGILIGADSDYCTVKDNYILDCSQTTTNTRDGIIMDGVNGASSNCDIQDNTIISVAANKMRYGINRNNAGSTGNRVLGNHLVGAATTLMNDLGTGTQLETIPLYIASYNVTDVSESEDGLVVDGVGEWVSFVGQLPLHVQQVVRFEIWGVCLQDPGAGNQMCLTIEIEGGASHEGKATHDTGALAGQLSEEIDPSVDDIIHWVCTDANALALLGGDSVKCACRYNAIVADDIATNAAFRRVLAHIV